MNPTFLPGWARQAIYAATAIGATALTAAIGWYLGTGEPQPDWLRGAIGAAAAIGIPVNTMAAAFTDRTPPPEPDDADGVNLMPALPEDGDQ